MGPWFLDAGRLTRARADGCAPAARAALRARRDDALGRPAPSVRDKAVVAPGGDPADYFSIPTYLWPDPADPSGTTWVMRDCERNPMVDDMDVGRFFRLVDTVEVLALLAFHERDREAGGRAVELVRHWFVDPATAMRPHLRYAQWSPAGTASTGTGIVDFQRSYLLLDLVELLRDGRCALDPTDDERLRAWFGALLAWFDESGAGGVELREPGNHATWFDVQVIASSLATGDRAHAVAHVEHHVLARSARHIRDDGTQPVELARPAAIEYATFNLFGFCVAAEMGRRAGADAWSDRGFARRFALAADWLLPHWRGDRPVGRTTKHHGTFTMWSEAAMLLSIAGERLGRDDLGVAASSLVVGGPEARHHLLVPGRDPGPEQPVPGPVPVAARVATEAGVLVRPARRVFVVGCPRSGTVWTRDILERHPLVVSGPESHLYAQLLPGFAAGGGPSARRRAVLERFDACTGGTWDDRGPGCWVSRAELEVLLGRYVTRRSGRDAGFAVIGEILDRSFATRGGRGGQVLVEKTPGHVHVAAEVLRRDPDALVVEVLRDGRDVMTSLGHMEWAPPGRAAQADLWARAVEAGMRARADAAVADRWHVLRFEALKVDPRAQITALLDFLDLPWDDDLVAAAVEATEFSTMQRARGEFTHRRRGRVGTWRDELTDDEVALFMSRAGDVLVAAGYGDQP